MAIAAAPAAAAALTAAAIRCCPTAPFAVAGELLPMLQALGVPQVLGTAPTMHVGGARVSWADMGVLLLLLQMAMLAPTCPTSCGGEVPLRTGEKQAGECGRGKLGELRPPLMAVAPVRSLR